MRYMKAPRITQMFLKYKPDTFIGKYMQYMENTETPTIYDLWCALWLLAVAVGGRTVVPRPNAVVNLNIYAILVAASGVTRKSTAVRVVERLAGRLFAEVNSRTPVLTTKMSPEALVAELHQTSAQTGSAHAAIAVSELVTVMGRERYVNAMPGLLTDLYDCPRDRRSFGTLVRGMTHLKNVYINFISASTPSWLLESVNPNVVEGGFTSRCVFVCAERRKKLVAWADTAERDDSELVAELVKVYNLSHDIREVELFDNSLEIFRKWYRKREEHTDPFRSSFESREDAHALKIAALLSINRGAWKINEDDLSNALRIVEQVKVSGAAIFEQIQERNDYTRVIDKMRSWLVAADKGGLDEDYIVRTLRNHAPAAWVRHALKVMHELNMIRKIEAERSGKRYVICVANTEMLVEKNLTELLHRVREGEEVP